MYLMFHVKKKLDYSILLPVAQLVKNPPAMQETPVQFPEKGSATHSSILGFPWWLRQ